MLHEELAGYRQLSVNEKATVMDDCPNPLLPSLAPDAMICGDVERITAPDAQLPVAWAPGVNELHWTLTALAGTAGQLVSVEAAACTLTDQLVPPFVLQTTDAAVLPLTGDASGSGELNAMLEGVTVTPLMVWAGKTPANTRAGRRRRRGPIRMPRS
jgi:hypothetical protein